MTVNNFGGIGKTFGFLTIWEWEGLRQSVKSEADWLSFRQLIFISTFQEFDRLPNVLS